MKEENFSTITVSSNPAIDNIYSEFHSLMQYRIRNILLVSSLYDSFVLSRDGQINEMILSEFMDMNLPQIPQIKRVSQASTALKMMKEEENQKFDLILSTIRVGDMEFMEFARQAKAINEDIPLIVLTYENREVLNLQKHKDIALINRIFLWQGDSRLFLAIVKYIEDQVNVEHDSDAIGVQVIILIEDNTKFYSSYLPNIYAELLRHSQNLLNEGLNISHKIMRMRARPKILLVDNYEEAYTIYKKYEKCILGVISDVEFLKGGKKDPEAGIHFVRRVRAKRPHLPIVLQSYQEHYQDFAKSLDISFIRKDSSQLMRKLRNFMVTSLGFGDFVFRLPDGTEVDRADNLKSFQERLQHIPEECLRFHGENNHFSTWLKARTEFGLANLLRPQKVSDFASLDAMRKGLIYSVNQFRSTRVRELVSDFSPQTFDENSSFARIGGGSLGGKGRGLAFIKYLFNKSHSENKFKGVQISIPPTVVCCSEVFDQFLELNSLRDFAIETQDDEQILKRFLQCEFPENIIEQLRSLLELIRYPIAIRSSSLLEDSQYMPFAGIYETYMLANNNPDINIRLSELMMTIKRIYATVFFQQARHHIETTSYRLEEEKMAVIIQKIVGQAHEERFYPNISGVARSYNYYPKEPLSSDDGIASVALGLGKMVVEGGESIRFSPKYPRHIQSFASVQDYLDNSQREFFALDLSEVNSYDHENFIPDLKKYYLQIAEKDGTLQALGSVYSPDNQAIYDGLSRPGVRLITFAPVLKFGIFPFSEILDYLLDLGKRGMSSPVEVEFAVNLSPVKDKPHDFSVVQIRPMVLHSEAETMNVDDIPPEDIICQSEKVLGLGKIDDIKDIVLVNINNFNRSDSIKVAGEIGHLNARLRNDNLPYLLIGIGRIGSADPWLGIPVTWDQISGSRVIVETGFKDMVVTPSQGTHFFHNLVSLRIGYFTINPDKGEGLLDWEWLLNQENYNETGSVRHIRLNDSLVIKMNGHKNIGYICKPGTSRS